MYIDLVVRKVAKYGVSVGGDTAEIAERPHGGLSCVLVDGQGSGPAAKNISAYAAAKAAGLISEGVRDGAVARAVHDYLYAHRRGKVQASLVIITADLAEGALVVTRNTECPAVYVTSEGVEVDAVESSVIGVHRMVRPVVRHFDPAPGIALVGFTDGIVNAGRRRSHRFTGEDIRTVVESGAGQPAGTIADRILETAMERDEGRPSDDMTVAVLKLASGVERTRVRKMDVRYPIDSPAGMGNL